MTTDLLGELDTRLVIVIDDEVFLWLKPLEVSSASLNESAMKEAALGGDWEDLGDPLLACFFAKASSTGGLESSK